MSVIFLFLTDLDLMLLIVAWMVVAPVTAAFVKAPAQVSRPGMLAGHLGAGAGFALAMVVAFYASALVLAPGS